MIEKGNDRYIKDIEKYLKDSLIETDKASTIDELEKIYYQYLGRKGKITYILRSLSSLPKDKRPLVGKKANEASKRIEKFVNEKKNNLKKKVVEKVLKEEIYYFTW